MNNSKEGSITLQVGMRVKVKDNVLAYHNDAGKEKVIFKELEPFNNKRAFHLYGSLGIWLIEDFEYCVGYPNLLMK